MTDVKTFALVIFDCDGVLVDTEQFYVELLLEFCAPYGLQMTLAEAMPLFVGVTLRTCMQNIENLCGQSLPTNFFEQFRDEFAKRISDNIKLIDGVKESLDEISLPVCVASNSSMDSLKQMLNLVGLYDYFKGCIFSAYDLKKWKPEPDLFLLAAKEMRTTPELCLVIEDSVVGVQAAQAAGMTVFAYAASPLTRAKLLACNVPVFEHMNQLSQLIAGNLNQ